MPHAFKATPDYPAVAYLVRLHADIGGRLLDNKKEAAKLDAIRGAFDAKAEAFAPVLREAWAGSKKCLPTHSRSDMLAVSGRNLGLDKRSPKLYFARYRGA